MWSIPGPIFSSLFWSCLRTSRTTTSSSAERRRPLLLLTQLLWAESVTHCGRIDNISKFKSCVILRIVQDVTQASLKMDNVIPMSRWPRTPRTKLAALRLNVVRSWWRWIHGLAPFDLSFLHSCTDAKLIPSMISLHDQIAVLKFQTTSSSPEAQRWADSLLLLLPLLKLSSASPFPRNAAEWIPDRDMAPPLWQCSTHPLPFHEKPFLHYDGAGEVQPGFLSSIIELVVGWSYNYEPSLQLTHEIFYKWKSMVHHSHSEPPLFQLGWRV